MILSKNAFTGYTFEHAWGDGVAGKNSFAFVKMYRMGLIIEEDFLEVI